MDNIINTQIEILLQIRCFYSCHFLMKSISKMRIDVDVFFYFAQVRIFRGALSSFGVKVCIRAHIRLETSSVLCTLVICIEHDILFS